MVALDRARDDVHNGVAATQAMSDCRLLGEANYWCILVAYFTAKCIRNQTASSSSDNSPAESAAKATASSASVAARWWPFNVRKISVTTAEVR
jgi:hypothetical protein